MFVQVYLDSGSYPDSGRLVSTLSVVPGQLQYDISTILNSSPLTARSVTVLSYTPPNLNLEDFVFHGEGKCIECYSGDPLKLFDFKQSVYINLNSQNEPITKTVFYHVNVDHFYLRS